MAMPAMVHEASVNWNDEERLLNSIGLGRIQKKQWRDADDCCIASHSDDVNDYKENDEWHIYGWRKLWGNLWLVLYVTTMLAGRRMLRDSFPYPYYFTLLLVLSAYVAVVVVVLLIRIGSCTRGSQQVKGRLSWLERSVIGLRLLASSCIAAISMLYSAKALWLYPSLPTLSMLPVLTFVSDSIIFRCASAFGLIRRDKKLSSWDLYRVVLVTICVAIGVREDYRTSQPALKAALSAIGLFSLSKLLTRLGPYIDSKDESTRESSLYSYLLAGLPYLAAAAYATNKFENIAAAAHIAKSWGVTYRILTFVPGVILHVLFKSSMIAAHPFISKKHNGDILEEHSDEARDSIATTMQAGFGVIFVGIWEQERNFVNWIQVTSFALIYFVCVGPKHMSFYPARVLNLILRKFRLRQIPFHAESWQHAIFLTTTAVIFSVLHSSNAMFLVNTLSFRRDLLTWRSPALLTLDLAYRPPEIRSIEIVIAHSAGDPIDDINWVIQAFGRLPLFANLNPKVTVYSQDPSFPVTDEIAVRVKGEFLGQVTIQQIGNVGGPTATYLHHILKTWAFLPVQVLFLSTSHVNEQNIQYTLNRLSWYYVQAASPLPDAMPKTGFLNLGEYEVCDCVSCHDTTGWEDTFKLVPTMWRASRTTTQKCQSVLLTHGNNFLASAARLRGVNRDIWQLLYDALVNPDMEHAWAHARDNMPSMLPGEKKMGRWAEGGIYGKADSLQTPYFGLLVERLWAILLQCSSADIAWKCPSFENWKHRRGGRRDDCGCIDQ